MLIQYGEYKKIVHKGNSEFIMLISLKFHWYLKFGVITLYLKAEWGQYKKILLVEPG